jgi:hypothetical protein
VLLPVPFRVAAVKLSALWSVFVATILLCGCTRGYKTVIGSETYAAVPPQHVAILIAFPSRAYTVIGLVHSHGAALASDDAVYRKFQKSAADMGADAVVVGNAAMNYRGTINQGSTSGSVYGTGYNSASYSGSYSGVSVPLYGLDVTGVAIRYGK